MDLSVVICTYNRSGFLKDTLASLYSCRNATSQLVEVLVIDNNSTDDTFDTCKELSHQHSNLRIVSEPRQGLSYARNRGIIEATGKIIAFLDDDIYLPTEWVNSVLGLFFSSEAISCAGGRIAPHFESIRPEWLPDGYLYIFGHFDLGDEPSKIVFPAHPFGGNMMIRKTVFDNIGFFDPDLGRTGTKLSTGEETEFFARVHDSGFECHYLPTAWIQHRIPAERTSPSWIFERVVMQSRSEITLSRRIGYRSRKELLTTACTALRTTWHIAFGSHHFNPKRAYWNYVKLSLRNRLYLAEAKGKFIQSFIECLRI